ncbi:MAG: MFS transporter [Planctomycetota bacterium]|nr:MFS transporter [Planctomycetota bacterium]
MSNATNMENRLLLDKPGMKSLSFNSLMVTQWLTSINDNIFRWLVIGIGKDYVNPGNWADILMVGSAVFLLPYLLLASPAGWLADRYRKVDVIIGCKIAEVAVMGLGVFAIAIGNLPLLFITVGLMGAQSALFAPSKVATIPDLVEDHELSAANGWFGLSTVTATIIGMGIGNWLADFCGDFGQSNLWAAAAILIGIAVVGTFFSLGIQKTCAANPTVPFPWNAPLQTFRDLKTLFGRKDLFIVSLGEMFFWSIGMLATLNIDSFAVENGGMFEVSKLPLLISLVFGVGFGSVLAGAWSAGRVELGMLHLGAFFISFFSFALLFTPSEFLDNGWEFNAGMILSCVFLMALGTSSGLFDVPLAAYLQKKSPPEKRGTILAANNFLIFTGMFANSLLFGSLGAAVGEGSVNNVTEIQQVSGKIATEQRLEMEKICKTFEKSLQAASQETDKTNGEPPAFIEILLGAENPKINAKKTKSSNSANAGLRIETYLQMPSELPEDLLYAHLLWTEFSHLKTIGELGTLDNYYERFPDKQPLTHSVFQQIGGLKRFTARQIFGIMGLATLPVFLFVMWRLPQASLRFDTWWIFRLIYRVEIRNEKQIPENLGAIIICNRISWLDRALFLIFSPRKIRLVAFTKAGQGWFEKWLRFWGQIRIAGGPASIQQGLVDARKALARGELLAVFPEEKISETGMLNAFDPGLKELLAVSPVPVVPAFIDEIWGSLFTYERGRLFWKWPKKIRQTIAVEFDEPLPRFPSVFETRQAVLKIGVKTMSNNSEFLAPVRQFIRQCKRRKFKFKLGDLTEKKVSGGMYLTGALVLRKLLRKHVLDSQEDRVGVLLPPTKGGAVVNMALALDQRTTVNLNYSASEEILNACIKAAGIKHVLTSQKLMSKLGLNLDAEVVELESLKGHVSRLDKVIGLLQSYAMPAFLLESSLGLGEIQPEDVSTIIFTSGSTGTPKGVMLTQSNVASNIEAFQKVIKLKPNDVLLGILPFFHSFGYTVTLWGNSMLDVATAYHLTPLDGRQIGKLCSTFEGTVLISTPTFLRGYLKRTPEEQFKTLDVVVTGAEKLPSDLADSFQEKFGIRPVEGYGATELSPVASVNVPPNRAMGDPADGYKEGSIGKTLPGVAAKIIDLDSNEELGPNQAGMLWIKGPNVMKGYYQREDLTKEAIVDGWYKTGDVAQIDENGFISITGRISRFSKIGGEMVPHVQIEDELNGLIGIDEETGVKAVVTAVSDEKKGERLVVVHTELEQSIDELRSGLSARGLPNLYIPSTDSFMQVESIPVLGTGKLDLKGVKNMAVEKFGP